MKNSPDRLRCVNLLTMNGKDSKTFSGRVARAGGIIPVYIHPYYVDGVTEREGPILSAYQTRRDTEISAHLGKGAPIVIFEESYLTKPAFRPTHPPVPACVKEPAQGTLYVVKGDPDPVGGSWDDIKRVLRNAKVKEIQLGGSLSGVCVTMAADSLAEQGFTFTFPLALFPPYPPIPSMLWQT